MYSVKHRRGFRIIKYSKSMLFGSATADLAALHNVECWTSQKTSQCNKHHNKHHNKLSTNITMQELGYLIT